VLLQTAPVNCQRTDLDQRESDQLPTEPLHAAAPVASAASSAEVGSLLLLLLLLRLLLLALAAGALGQLLLLAAGQCL
jgi:hypothetical protein